jgi:hypothetical protein
MRVQMLIVASALAVACKNQPPPAVTTAPSRAQVQAPTEANAIRGKVVEKIDVTQYTYLRLQTGEGDVWAAVPRSPAQVGEMVAVVGAVWMQGFKSTTLDRTFDRIAFGTLAGESPATAPAAAPQAAGAGMFAAQAAAMPAGPPASSAAMPAGHPAPSAPADTGPIKVAKARGGRTIAEVYAAKAALEDKQVTVRGKVVKATNGVLGKNWLHLRDGTGKSGSDDLAVASDETAPVGATVLVSGVVHLDRDLGAGYHYDVLVEDAKVRTE